MTASPWLWTFCEAHRRARELIIERLQAIMFGGADGPVTPLLDAYRAIAGDTHALLVDEGCSEVFEAQIDRSRRRHLH